MLEPRSRVLCWTLLGGLGVGSTGLAQSQPSDEFLVLDTPRKEFHNFNIETVRGMVWSPDRASLYAINTHGSRLVRHDDADGTIDKNWTTVHNPVAIALWDRGVSGFDVLVLGGASHVLALHDPFTGAIHELLNLPSEPGDIVLTPDDQAFVSCMGANVVVQIDLASFSVVQEYAIPSQRPRFLSTVEDGQGGYRVFVAPFLSGNNTVRNAATKPATVLALPPDDPSTPEWEGLPDEDLYELVPATGDVNPVVKGVGHLMLEHALGSNGMYWALSILPENADPARQTEPALKGDFATSALTRFALPAQGAPPIVAPAPIDLDDYIVGNGQPDYDTNESCSFPFALAIDPASGYALVASSTNDRLILLDPSGNRFGWKRDLPQGSIPRDILIDPITQSVAIYLWGSNEILWLSLGDLNGAGVTFELGLDPTPASIAHGRELWYDAENSEHARSTCNTCHPGGSSDFLGWPLSGDPEDRKDVMVTQSLLSIEDTFPYHWRGERELRDFNRLAFPGLLGGQTLNGPNFEDFQEFVFSLQAPRNPGEDVSRKLVGDAVAGQQGFVEVDALFEAFTCAECHMLPEGTIGSLSADNDSLFPQALHMDVAPLRQLYNKETTLIDVAQFEDPLPRSGWGLSHDGDRADLFDFLDPVTFPIPPQQRTNITAFVRQFDQGIAPAAQMGWLFDQGHLSSKADVEDILFAQAVRGWLDVIAFGTIQDSAGGQVFARWLYDPTTDTFRANDPALTLAGRPSGTAVWDDFVTQAQGGTASNTFLGLPLGNGYRFALDPDNDRLLDGVELAHVPKLYPENPDSDGDGDPDGHEEANGGDAFDDMVQSNDTVAPALLPGFPAFIDTNATTAEYELRFTEPVTYTFRYTAPDGTVMTRSRIVPVMQDTITLQEMRPSSQDVIDQNGVVVFPGTPSTYTLELEMLDQRVGPQTPTLVSVAHQPTMANSLEPYLEPDNAGMPKLLRDLALVVADLNMAATRSGSTLTADVDAQVAAMHQGLNNGFGNFYPQEGQVVLGQVLLHDGSDWQVVPANMIDPPGTAFTHYYLQDIAGKGDPAIAPMSDVVPMQITEPGPSGKAKLQFTVSGLSPGDRVRFNVVGIYQPTGGSEGGMPVYTLASHFTWQLGSTQDDPLGDPNQSRRGVEVTF